MNCQFCGRKITTAKSIERRAGPCCYRRDSEQIKLDFGVTDEQSGKAGRAERDIQAGQVDVSGLRTVSVYSWHSAIGSCYRKHEGKPKEVRKRNHRSPVKPEGCLLFEV